MEYNIVKRNVKLRPANYVDFSLSEDAKVMRKLNILGISEENIRFTRVYKKILLSIALPSKVLSKLDEVLSQAKVNRSTLDLFTRHANNVQRISVEDFINCSSCNSKFDRDVVVRAFTFLEQINLIKKTFSDNDIKYILADEKLHKLIQAIGDVFIEELFLLTYKWRHFSQPTKEEKDRLEWIIGSDTSKRIMQVTEIARFEDKNARRTSNNISEYNDYLKSACLGENERSMIDQELESYNLKRKISDRTKKSKERHSRILLLTRETLQGTRVEFFK
jgi:hypothetical protein